MSNRIFTQLQINIRSIYVQWVHHLLRMHSMWKYSFCFSWVLFLFLIDFVVVVVAVNRWWYLKTKQEEKSKTKWRCTSETASVAKSTINCTFIRPWWVICSLLFAAVHVANWLPFSLYSHNWQVHNNSKSVYNTASYANVSVYASVFSEILDAKKKMKSDIVSGRETQNDIFH